MIPRRWEKEIFHSYYGTRSVFSTSSCYYWLLRLEDNISFFFILHCSFLLPIIIFTYFSCRRKVYRQRIVTPFVNSSFYTCIYWHIFFAVAFSRTFFKKSTKKLGTREKSSQAPFARAAIMRAFGRALARHSRLSLVLRVLRDALRMAIS